MENPIPARRSGSAIALILGAGAALRLLIAFVVAPGQSLASDLGLFGQWQPPSRASAPAPQQAGLPATR